MPKTPQWAEKIFGPDECGTLNVLRSKQKRRSPKNGALPGNGPLWSMPAHFGSPTDRQARFAARMP
ncbi:MAG TPA: hypothetical protein VF306_05930, partial [Pirellulales bacterium]